MQLQANKLVLTIAFKGIFCLNLISNRKCKKTIIVLIPTMECVCYSCFSILNGIRTLMYGLPLQRNIT